MINNDWRRIRNGWDIPSEAGYCDQPSIVRAQNGHWVCSVTSGKGHEGAKGQYVNITRSADQGRTWSKPIPIEETDWESAYSSLAVAPSGRIYCFYCYNLDHIDIDRADLARYDMGGYYCFRVSCDHGVTWSQRYIVPIRDFDVDLGQEEAYRQFEGKPLRFFWNVSRVFFDGDTCYSALIKYHYKADDVLHSSEGVLLQCENLDADPANACWLTLPEGMVGIRTPAGGGRVAEEQSFVKLSDGTLYCTFRTIDGHPAYALSRDGGRTFAPSQYLTYADGSPLKHNRAATFIWPLGQGKYLYWYNTQGLAWFKRRNPVWCAVATEVQTPEGLNLAFSQPEILLYDDYEYAGISYPDLLWDGGWYVTETQKIKARIHPIPDRFVAQITQGPTEPEEAPMWLYGAEQAFPALPLNGSVHGETGDFIRKPHAGHTLCFVINDAKPLETLLDTETPEGGFHIALDEHGCLTLRMGDVMADSVLQGSIPIDGRLHHAALILDAKAHVLYFVIDGRMDDGGQRALSGWRWMNTALVEIPACDTPKVSASVRMLSVYPRPLLTCEASGLAQAQGCDSIGERSDAD